MSIEPLLYEGPPGLGDQGEIRQLFPSGMAHGGAPVPGARWGNGGCWGDSDQVAGQMINHTLLDFDGQACQANGMGLGEQG